MLRSNVILVALTTVSTTLLILGYRSGTVMGSLAMLAGAAIATYVWLLLRRGYGAAPEELRARADG